MNIENMVEIGKAGAAVGLKGEFKINLISDDTINLVKGKKFYYRKDKEIKEVILRSVRKQGEKTIISFEEIKDRNETEHIKGCTLYISEDELEKLPKGEYYIRDLIGLDVYDRNSKKIIGKLNDVIQNTPQSIYSVIDENGKEILIPAVDEFVKEINLQKGIIEVKLIEGFID